MFKKSLLVIASFIFATSVLATSVIRITAQTVPFYQVAGETVNLTLTPTPMVVNYHLAYPGLLPDHFLYRFKMLRDKIWLSLTRDPYRKAEVLLLFADKRLGAAQALIVGGQEELGVTTLTKAEKYLVQTASQIEQAEKTGRKTDEFKENLAKASLKHQEVILGLLSQVSDQNKGVVNEGLRLSQEVYEKVAASLPETQVTPTPSQE